MSGATLDAVIGWQFPVAGAGLGWSPVGGVDNTDYRELAITTLAEAVAGVSPPPGTTVHQQVIEGSAAQVLLEAASGADLLVVGNRGHNEFEDALIGSVSIRCLHHATCPVVVVHGPKHHK